MRIVVELKRGENADTLLNNLYQQTPLETVFGINLVALVEGLAVALANIDPVIELIKASPSAAEARTGLMERSWPPGVVSDMLARAGADTSRPDGLPESLGLVDGGYRLSETQAQAILDLRLHRLTGLEQEKILKEYDEILVRIADLIEILSNPDRLREVIRTELEETKAQFADPRRTEIQAHRQGFDPADFVTPQDVVVTLSHEGYVKWQPTDSYGAQRRGGKGRTAATTKADDFVERLFVANSHDNLLCFSSRGKVYWLKVYQLPEASRTARGTPIVNLLPHMEPGERISAVRALKSFDQGGFVVFATSRGLVKKTPLADFSRPRASGIIAIDLMEDDWLVGVDITDGERDLMLASSNGKVIRFHEAQVRPMGRTARGVIGMRLPSDARVISLIVVDEGLVLSATEHGYGKSTRVDEYPLKGRGGQGVINIRTTERNGPVLSALLMDGSKLVRTPVDGVSVLGRNTQGVRLITLGEGERLVGVGRVLDDGEALGDGEAPGDGDAPPADEAPGADDGGDPPHEA